MALDLLWWHWGVITLCLFALEVMAPGAFFLWLAMGSGAVSLILLGVPHLSLGGQLIFFALFSLVGLVVGKKWFKKHDHTPNSFLNNRAQAYIGQVYTLAEPMVHGRGHLKIDDTVWTLMGEDMPAGTIVRITGLEGLSLKVIKETK
jgi:membrane protein implicated in regulation of membrane protease activity